MAVQSVARKYPIAAVNLIPRGVNRQHVSIDYKASNTCSRCGHTFRTMQERMIDSQFPQVSGQTWIMAYRCRNKKACQKRAEKD